MPMRSASEPSQAVIRFETGAGSSRPTSADLASVVELPVVDGAACALPGLLVGVLLGLGTAEAGAVCFCLAFALGARLVLADLLEIDDLSHGILYAARGRFALVFDRRDRGGTP